MAEINFALGAVPAIGVLLVSSLVVLASRDWRWTIAAMGVQYAAMFILVAGIWRLELAVVKLVAGWMATAILGASHEPAELERGSPSGGLFRVLVGGMVALVVFSVAPDSIPVLESYLPRVNLLQVVGGLLLVGMGLALLGLTSTPLRVALALLMFSAGFEILYAMVEDSTLVAGLLALVNLAMASIGAYLHVAPQLNSPRGVQ